MPNVLAAFFPFTAPLWEPRILSIRFMTVARGRRLYETRVQTDTYDLRARGKSCESRWGLFQGLVDFP